MPELLLLRHAKSSHKDKTLEDYDRPLAKRGRRDCRLIGNWLREHDMVPDLVVSSPSKRTTQTVKRVGKRMAIDKDIIRWDEKIYDASYKGLIKVISKVPEDCQKLMVVGHHEALEAMILRKCRWADIPPNPKLIPTAAVAILEFESKWSDIKKADARLQAIVRPRELVPADATMA